jgi:hypothetical protein
VGDSAADGAGEEQGEQGRRAGDPVEQVPHAIAERGRRAGEDAGVPEPRVKASATQVEQDCEEEAGETGGEGQQGEAGEQEARVRQEETAKQEEYRVE